MAAAKDDTCPYCHAQLEQFQGTRGRACHLAKCPGVLATANLRRLRPDCDAGEPGGDDDGGGEDAHGLVDEDEEEVADEAPSYFGSAVNEAVAAMYARRPDLSKGLLNEMLGIFSPHVPGLFTSAGALLSSLDDLPGIHFEKRTVTLPQRPLRAGEVAPVGGATVNYALELRDLREVVRRSMEQHGAKVTRPALEAVQRVDDVTTGKAYQDQLQAFQRKHGPEAVLVPLIFHSGSLWGRTGLSISAAYHFRTKHRCCVCRGTVLEPFRTDDVYKSAVPYG